MLERRHKYFVLCPLLYFCSLINLASFIFAQDQFVYSGFVQANLSLDGSATITRDGLLELTNGGFNLKGHVFYPTPKHFRVSPSGNVQSFTVTFIFCILSAYSDKSADGMAFFITPNNNFSDAFPAQYLGLLNDQNNRNRSNHIFAVELDTIQNSEFEDISDNHVGINLNSLQSVEAQNAAFYDEKTGTFKNLSLISHDVMQVWVEYDEGKTQIDVTLAPIKRPKPTRPLVSAIYNLSTVLTDTAYVGFSAATGGGLINSRHCLLGWSFSIGNETAPRIDITKLPKLLNLGSRSTSKILMIVPPVAIGSLIFLCGAAIMLARRKWAYNELQEDWEIEFGPHRFSYKDLVRATDGFKNNNMLGAGGFGKVYKGILPSSKLEIAVKKLSHESKQGLKEFINEIVSIGHLRHRNLVQLLGYCRRKGELLLVYEYMPNGSLDKHLHYDQQNIPSLDWATRFHIIKGVACGLLYLHEKWDNIVIHRDIKASNVLLDSGLNGRLGDFGLAKSYGHGTDPQTTHVVGTVGYLAPELVRTGKASPLTDVFAFGTLLLEVTCGKRPVKHNAQGERFMLVDWVFDHLQKGSMVETIDKRLHGNCNIDEACLVLKLGLLCSQPVATARPDMHLVMQYLSGDMPLPEFTPSDMSFSMLALTENKGFDPSSMSYQQLMTSVGTMSSLSGGR